MKKILIMSDIHGNLSALDAVLQTEKMDTIDGVILLGDLIDYGPRSNEVIDRIKNIPLSKILVNIWGNHEKVIMDYDDSRFSSERGKKSAMFTRNNLSEQSLKYIDTFMEKTGELEFDLNGKKCLAIHGSLNDPYWKSISHMENDEAYRTYDIVFSGHSHLPHFFEHFYEVNDLEYRNKKKTMFINPGSVGQPRNHNENAQYVMLEVETFSVQMKAVRYPIELEMALYDEIVDTFYKERLKRGI